MADRPKRKRGPFDSAAWYDPSDWSFKPSTGFNATLRAIALIVVLILGFSVGLTTTQSSAGAAGKLIDSLGGDYKGELRQAYSLIVSGSYNEASEIASSVLRDDPDSPLAHHILGLAHAHRGLIEEAALSFQKATELYPEFDVAWYDLGVVEESRGEFDRALSAYREAVRLKLDNAIYVAAESRLQKIVLGEDAWDRNEVEAEGLFLEGVTAINRGGPDDLEYAEGIFRSLTQERPYDVAARNMLAVVLVRRGRLDEAERALLQVVTDEPGFADAWYNLGMLHRAQGRLEEALEDFETAYASSSLDTFRAITQRQIAEITDILASETDLTPPAVTGTDESSEAPDPVSESGDDVSDQ